MSQLPLVNRVPDEIGCLVSMAQVEDVACLEMLDFGIMLPLLELTRSKSLVDQVRIFVRVGARGMLGGVQLFVY